MQNRWFQCPHGLELLQILPTLIFARMCFNALSGLSCYTVQSLASAQCISFNALTGLSCYGPYTALCLPLKRFNALTGLSCYARSTFTPSAVTEFQCPHGLELLLQHLSLLLHRFVRFNALTGLSCYGKNVQYFKFFMILFYTYLLFIGAY